MNTVESKYKNPDRYIERLKREAQEAWRLAGSNYRLYEKAKGVSICDGYQGSVDTDEEVRVTSDYFDELKPGDKVAFITEVEEVREYTSTAGTRCSAIKVQSMPIEIRKIGK